MVEVPIFIVILIGIALTVVIWIEAREYRKYQVAAKSVVAFGEGMKIIVEQMGENMGRFSAIQTALTLDAEEKDRQIQSLNSLVATHTDILTLKLLSKMADGVTDDGLRD